MAFKIKKTITCLRRLRTQNVEVNVVHRAGFINFNEEGVNDELADYIDGINEAAQIDGTGRANDYTIVNQEDTGLCGPAAFFYCLLKESFRTYKRVVDNLREDGVADIGRLRIKPSRSCRHSRLGEIGDINQINWMTLMGLRETSNNFIEVDEHHHGNLAGVTTPSRILEWFEKAGANTFFYDMPTLGLRWSFSEVQLTQTIEKFLEMQQNHPNNFHAVAFIHGSYLDRLYRKKDVVDLNPINNNHYRVNNEGVGRFRTNNEARADHFVVVEELTLNNEEISYTFISWGARIRRIESIENFRKMFKGIMIVSRIPAALNPPPNQIVANPLQPRGNDGHRELD